MSCCGNSPQDMTSSNQDMTSKLFLIPIYSWCIVRIAEKPFALEADVVHMFASPLSLKLMLDEVSIFPEEFPVPFGWSELTYSSSNRDQ